jgi:hypothetical protein
MGKRIRIAVAYKGLTYMPLFLANCDPAFSAQFELVFTDDKGAPIGDGGAIDLLLKKDNGCDIAICDPFAKNIIEITKDRYNSADFVKLIGCLIDKSPMWIYRVDPAIAPKGIKAVEQLKDSIIVRIKGYEHPNTGWIFCSDLQDRINPKPRTKEIPIEPVNFDPDHEDKIENGEILVTSNILKIALADYKNGNGIKSSIYSYGTSKDLREKLKDLFFTGIIVRKDKYNADDSDYVWFCNKLIYWIDRLYREDVNVLVAEHFEFFKKHVQKYKGIEGLNDEQEKVIFRNILWQIQNERIYPVDLRGSSSKFNKMMRIRKVYNKDLVPVKYSKFWDDYLLRRTQRPLGFWKRLRFFFTKQILRTIKRWRNSGPRSIHFIWINLIQLIPSVAISILAIYMHTVKQQVAFKVVGIICAIVSILNSFFMVSIKENEPERDEFGRQRFKIDDYTLTIVLALIFAILLYQVTELSFQ